MQPDSLAVGHVITEQISTLQQLRLLPCVAYS